MATVKVATERVSYPLFMADVDFGFTLLLQHEMHCVLADVLFTKAQSDIRIDYDADMKRAKEMATEFWQTAKN